jgi:hypothetical protein
VGKWTDNTNEGDDNFEDLCSIVLYLLFFVVRKGSDLAVIMGRRQGDESLEDHRENRYRLLQGLPIILVLLLLSQPTNTTRHFSFLTEMWRPRVKNLKNLILNTSKTSNCHLSHMGVGVLGG